MNLEDEMYRVMAALSAGGSSFLTAPACFLIIYYHYREGKRLCPPQK